MSQALAVMQNTLTSQKDQLVSVLGNEAQAEHFKNNMLALIATDNKLDKCEPLSVMKAGLVATTLGLSLNQQLGYAYLVPYEGYAQLQIGWKGYVQLAIRSNQYSRIAAVTVYEGQLTEYNALTCDIKYNAMGRKTSKVDGFLAFFRMTNGFEASLFMSLDDMKAHASNYSQSYKRGKSSPWSSAFNEMGCKTVLKLLLKRYGVLDTSMQQAIAVDQSAETEDGTTYIDAEQDEHAEFDDDLHQPAAPAKHTNGNAPITTETISAGDFPTGNALKKACAEAAKSANRFNEFLAAQKDDEKLQELYIALMKDEEKAAETDAARAGRNIAEKDDIDVI